MRNTQQWGQIVLGIGIGLLIGAVTSYFRQATQAATIALVLAALCVGVGLSLMRRGGQG